MKFSVWAPTARRVELCIGACHWAMTRRGREHWELEWQGPEPRRGMPYRYVVDGSAALPDPSSRWQPDGVHGDSRAGPLPGSSAPPQKFQAKPLADAILYEMHLGTFTPQGTYVAAQEKLRDLAALGVTHVELMPLATFPGRHGWGYDGVYWFAPHPAYGTPAELVSFVDACHGHGLAVLLDVVYNHLGPDGNYLPRFGPCFSSRGKTLWGEAMNFDDAHSDGMRQLVLDNATMWLRDYGFDGLRLDAVHAIFDQRAVHILEELADHVKLLGEESGRHFVVIAESDLHDPRLVRPRALGGYGLDAFWADDFHHAVHRFLTGETDRYYADFNGLADIARAIREGYVYQGQYAPSRHRSQGRPPGALATAQLVFCIQNHDQIGNRAAGERLGMLVSPAKARAAATLLLLAPQVPLLFQGEEWAASTPFLYFTDHADPELGRAVTEGRRREFPSEVPVPDPQAADTFQRSQLQWTERELPRHSEMLGWYRRLIALRKKIRHAPCEVQCDAAAGWLTLRRGPVLALFNFSELAQPVPVPEGKWRLVLSSGPEQAMAGSVPSLTTWVLALEMWEGAPFAEGAVN